MNVYFSIYITKALVVLVVLQVGLVLPGVARHDDENRKVEQRLTGGIVAVNVGGSVLAPRRKALLGRWRWARWQLLVEGHDLGHSLGVRVRADVLEVSI